MASISVRCDHVVDCGMHTIEERAASFSSPTDTARGTAEVAAWLLERGGTAEPPDSWRARDNEPGERRPASRA
ncbi:hypothetical protein ACGFX4_23770 [Kitasatospora sp. NPDC048365]|uniref:hypothetical protein n=1 Tax=Kitasatospora sp. NPDC048365 TaxID=3364050 RepID=UPI00371890B7